MTYDPELYDAVTPSSFLGDVDWYRRQAVASGGPVLELGAGTGRVTVAIAEAGIAVHALDASEPMLRRLKSKLEAHSPDLQARVALVVADMRSFELPQQFRLVIAPYRAFLHNVSEEDRTACLQQVRKHLAPQGRFAFNVFHPSLEFMAQHAGPFAGIWRWMATHDLPAGGFVVRSEANRYDTVQQVVHSQQRYDVYDATGVFTRSSLHRLKLAYLYLADIRRLLSAVGFHDITIHGGFDGREFSRDTDELVVEASI